jgi:hypothetical protein
LPEIDLPRIAGELGHAEGHRPSRLPHGADVAKPADDSQTGFGMAAPRWPPGWEGGDDTYSQEPCVPYRWHHVVGQVDGDHIELYLNGRISSALSITPEHSDLPCHPVVGRMDEVALYDHPLTVEQIRDHHRLGAATSHAR